MTINKQRLFHIHKQLHYCLDMVDEMILEVYSAEELALAGHRLLAMKKHRLDTGCGLIEAKDWVEDFLNSNPERE